MSSPSLVPPVWTGQLNQQQRALIAGFLLHSRQGILDALTTMHDPIVDQIIEWSGPTRQYYVAAEAYSRYLLWLIGYPVQRNQMYEEMSYEWFPPTMP